MRLFPVCCAVDIPAEVMHAYLCRGISLLTTGQVINRFLKATYDEEKAERDVDDLLVVIDRLGGEPFTEATIPPVTDFSSPFRDKTVEECAKLLREEAERQDSDISPYLFVVLDERTIRDSTVLIVQALGNESDNESESQPGSESTSESELGPGILNFRCIFKTTQSNLGVIEIAHPGIEEFIEHANEEEDGVLKD